MVFRFLLAVVVALGIPVSQLRMPDIVVTCCCPDPANCHCPDHKPDHSGQTRLRACHRVEHDATSPQAPSFTSNEVAIAAEPARVAPSVLIPLHAPHAPPPPADPAGPS